MITRYFGAALMIAIVFVSGPAFGKGTTVQLSITGPGINAPLHLSDQSVITANVWFGNFADWDTGRVEPPVDDSSQYLVHFWVQFGPGDIQMKYVIRYHWNEELNRAVVCLPGRRDIWYRNNSYSILRDGQDGNCFYADQDWGAAIKAALQ